MESGAQNAMNGSRKKFFKLKHLGTLAFFLARPIWKGVIMSHVVAVHHVKAKGIPEHLNAPVGPHPPNMPPFDAHFKEEINSENNNTLCKSSGAPVTGGFVALSPADPLNSILEHYCASLPVGACCR